MAVSEERYIVQTFSSIPSERWFGSQSKRRV